MHASASDRPSGSPDPEDAPAEPTTQPAEGPAPGGAPLGAAVLDSSAVLALLFAEHGAGEVADAIVGGAVLSTVNFAEVATVLARRGLNAEATLAPLRDQIRLEPFNGTDALAAAALYAATASAGLSLGDRACLALAQRLAVPALTAERLWAELALDVTVRLIRDSDGGEE